MIKDTVCGLNSAVFSVCVILYVNTRTFPEGVSISSHQVSQNVLSEHVKQREEVICCTVSAARCLSLIIPMHSLWCAVRCVFFLPLVQITCLTASVGLFLQQLQAGIGVLYLKQKFKNPAV